jgi:hypothetical protein
MDRSLPIPPAPRLFAVLVLALLVPAMALAQFQTGNVFGTVLDNQGQPLPGVTITLSGIGAPQTFVTGPDGKFRFLSLAAGHYSLRADLSGFGTVTRSAVDVNIGRNTDITITLAPALEETITVTADTPLLDVRRAGTGASIPQIELDAIPSARDPWVVLQQVPGITMDRINIGGNESGQQSVYVGKGVSSDNNTWNVDGVTITDMSALGSSPTYYDFGAFEEMQATTGGSDPRIQSPGVNLNMVTKRGTNDLEGSARYFFTDNDYQEDADVPAEALGYLERANEINRIEDYGLEAGGPFLRDRLWFWGAYGVQDISNLTAARPGSGPSFDNTELENFNAKLNAQLFSSNSATGFFTRGEKIKTGRNVGTTRPPETAWNQGGPTDIWKFEDTHIFSPSFYLTGLYSKVEGGFFLTPAGGRDVDMYSDADGVYHRSYYHYETTRPQEQYRLDGSSFLSTGAIDHELRYGFGYREALVDSLLAWPGSGNWGYFDELAWITRDGAPSVKSEYNDLYIGDTILWGNFTFQAGLRWDKSSGLNTAASAPANSVYPELLPELVVPADARELEWDAIVPRLAVSYTMGQTRRTLLRAAYNQYTGLVTPGEVSVSNPVGLLQALIFPWTDANGDHVVQRGEVDLTNLIFPIGVDPNNPTSVSSPIRIDYHSDPPKTDEIILGFEHEVLSNFTVGMNYTHREQKDTMWWVPEKTRGSGDFFSPADYTNVAANGQPLIATGTLPNGETYSVPYWRLRDGSPRPTFYVFTNRPNYTRMFDGLELLATKRLSNRWMMRASLGWNDMTQDQGEGSYWDPSPILTVAGAYGSLLVNTGCIGSGCDGEVIAEQSVGSGGKGNIFINAGWTANVTGLYQLPAGFSVGAAFTAREGYPIPWIHTIATGLSTGNRSLLIKGFDDRLDDIMNLDLRIAKEFRIADLAGLTLSADIFNVTDERTVLQRDRQLTTPSAPNSPFSGAGFIQELQSPRVIRLGAMFSF